jgi:hypothetical protein
MTFHASVNFNRHIHVLYALDINATHVLTRAARARRQWMMPCVMLHRCHVSCYINVTSSKPATSVTTALNHVSPDRWLLSTPSLTTVDCRQPPFCHRVSVVFLLPPLTIIDHRSSAIDCRRTLYSDIDRSSNHQNSSTRALFHSHFHVASYFRVHFPIWGSQAIHIAPFFIGTIYAKNFIIL